MTEDPLLAWLKDGTGTARPAPPSRPRRRAARRPSFPVVLAQLPTVRCGVCPATVVVHRGKTASEALTAHYGAEHG